MDALLGRITIDPDICHGKPCVRGLRYPVETLLELLSAGMTAEEILSAYEDLVALQNSVELAVRSSVPDQLLYRPDMIGQIGRHGGGAP